MYFFKLECEFSILHRNTILIKKAIFHRKTFDVFLTKVYL